MKAKPTVALEAIGIYAFMNAAVFIGAHILRWVFLSPFGHWLELDGRPFKPYVPGGMWVAQILLLIIAFGYYRDKTRRI